MNLHEYQAKELFQRFNIPVLPNALAGSVAEAVEGAKRLGGTGWIVKAQVHAGGRGKAGGVKPATSFDEVERAARSMLGTSLVTKQTGATGLPIDKVLLEPMCAIARELYVSLVVDRSSKRVAVIASAVGGTDIEEVAVNQPDQVMRLTIDPITGLMPFQCRQIGFGLGLPLTQINALQKILENLYRLFISCDASLVEINPLIVTTGDQLIALDAKINLDENGLYRQSELESWRDTAQEDVREVLAQQHQLNYISLAGNIGCMVNGAGLAMATMDLIKLHGGDPANFLDVGGGTTAERVAEAFKLILSDTKVKAVLVNIFGGIVRCDLIAEGIIKAVQEVHVTVPVVVRLEGTNVQKGRDMLAQSGLAIIASESLTDAAHKVVRAAMGGGSN